VGVFKIVFLAILVAIAAGAFAQIDPDPDGIGVYFDTDATVVSATVQEGVESITAYLILTNPSSIGNLKHWSVRVSSYHPSFSEARIVGTQYVGFNLALNMPGSGHYIFEISVGDAVSPTSSPITILAELIIFPWVYTEPILLFVGPGFESAFYGTDNGGADFNPSSGSFDFPVAIINGPTPVAVEPLSWGQVKSLFR
jgi:hypothetical protein